MEHLSTTEYESAILFGRAEEITDDFQKIQALRLLCQCHAPKNMDRFDEAIQRSLGRTAIWRLNIERSTGKRKKYDQHGKEMKYGRME
ncbi:MAG: pyridoxamine 5'-phosphate oxidase family protein [Clostridiales bacterium]|nr:pyridoxamine 5'-phosphate oxidase family protein [Clostridiales bacterium]